MLTQENLYNLLPILSIIAFALLVIFLVLWVLSKSKARIHREENIQLKSQMDALHEMLNKAEQVRDEAFSKLEFEVEAKQNAELKANMSQKEMELMKTQMEDWEETKQKHLEAAKASMLEASSKLSNKLLEDHKRENEHSKKESEERVQKTTEELQGKFQNVFENMKSLTDRVENFGSSVDVIQNSLLNPQGAGALAEVTLENILKNSGLERDRDYKMQHSVDSVDTGRKLRPDAVIFLPADRTVVVDSKASKFFLEYGKAVDEEKAIKEVELKTSMNKHLNDLISKDYKASVEESLNIKHQNIVQMLMFMPTEDSARTIMDIDSKFFEKAISNNIIPVGPVGLVNLLMQAKMIIDKSKQDENYHKIIDEVGKMIESVAKLHNHAEGMGKSLHSSLDKYNKFVGSFNTTFLSKVNKIKAYGVKSKEGAQQQKLVKYETFKNDSIEEEKEEN